MSKPKVTPSQLVSLGITVQAFGGVDNLQAVLAALTATVNIDTAGEDEHSATLMDVDLSEAITALADAALNGDDKALAALRRGATYAAEVLEILAEKFGNEAPSASDEATADAGEAVEEAGDGEFDGFEEVDDDDKIDLGAGVDRLLAERAEGIIPDAEPYRDDVDEVAAETPAVPSSAMRDDDPSEPSAADAGVERKADEHPEPAEWR